MKITIGELMEKIDDVNRVIGELHKLPQDVCELAEEYLQDYLDMLKNIKVDIY